MSNTAKLLLCVSIAIIICISPAYAITLTFEDLKAACDAKTTGADAYFTAIPNEYAGLIWDDFLVVDAPMAEAYYGMNSGYVNGAISGSVVAFNPVGSLVSFRHATTPLILRSAYLTSAWHEGMSVRAEGYLGGSLKYTKTVVLDKGDPTFVNYDFYNVDMIIWSCWGGTKNGIDGVPPNFAMDNLSYDLVPEPSSVLALLCGIGGMGSAALRRKSS